MWNSFRILAAQLAKSERAQTNVEYALILLLVALATVVLLIALATQTSGVLLSSVVVCLSK